jgi:hypothetical protein
MRNSLFGVLGTVSLLVASACVAEVGGPGDDIDDSVVIDDNADSIETGDPVIDESAAAHDADITDGSDDEIGRIGYVPPEPNATQMAVNGSFDYALFTDTGWQIRGSTSYVKKMLSAAYQGLYGLRTESTALYTGWVVQCMPAVAGHTYQLTAWTQRISGEGTGHQTLHLVFHGAMYSPGSIVMPDSTTWNKVSLRRVAPAGTEKLCIALGAVGQDAPSKRNWDNVSLYRAD